MQLYKPSVQNIKEPPPFRMEVLCLRYLFSRGGEPTAAGGRSSNLRVWLHRILRTHWVSKGRSLWSSGESGNHTRGSRRLFAYFLAGEKVWQTCKQKIPPPFRMEAYNMLALPIFTASRPATIVGVRVLNFCVRDGNRWTHTTINTNLLTLVTHTGFEPMLTA